MPPVQANAGQQQVAMAQEQARQVGELIGELRSVSRSVENVWSKVNEISGYVHKREHDLLDMTAANAKGLALLNMQMKATVDALKTTNDRIDNVVTAVDALTKMATKGEGMWIFAMKVSGLILGIGGLFAVAASYIRPT